MADQVAILAVQAPRGLSGRPFSSPFFLPMPGTRPFRLGNWEVRPDLNELRRRGRRIRIQPRHMGLLATLTARSGEVVTREELIESVWDRQYVNDEVLSRAVASLRRALGDDARQPRYIETIPKRGYRLVAKPEFIVPGNRPRRAAAWIVVTGILFIAAVGIHLLMTGYPQRSDRSLQPAHVRVLTARPGAERAPVLSPDARRVAYLADSDDDGLNEVWIMETSSASRRRLATNGRNVTALTWSPGGDRLAVTLDDGTHCELALLHADGSGIERELAACAPGLGSGIDWSANGRWLAFAYPVKGANAGLARVAVADGTVEPLTAPDTALTIDADPRFRPDDEAIAFTRGDGTIREAWILETGVTHGPRRLTHDGQYVVSVAWRSDRALLFSSDRDGRQAIREIDPATGRIAFVGADGARGLDWANGMLVWERPTYRANIWRLGPGRAPEPVIASNRYDNHPAPSPAGDTLAFLSNRSGRSGIWLAAPDGADQRLLVEREGARLSRPGWHPSGQRLLAAVFESGRSYLAAIDRDGNMRELPGTSGAEEGQWLPDGRRLVFVGHEGERTWLFLVDPAGERRRLGSFTPSRVAVSGSGDVYFTRAGEPGLFRLRGGDGPVEAVLPDLPVAAWNDWSLGGRLLAWSDERGVWLRPLDADDPARLIHDRRTDVIGLSLGVAPRGPDVYASYTDNVEIDVAIAPYEP